MLTSIKLLHTLIWTFLAAGIVALPIAGVLRRFRRAAILTGLVLLECGVLALNGGRCPLSDLAASSTRCEWFTLVSRTVGGRCAEKDHWLFPSAFEQLDPPRLTLGIA